MLKGLGGLGDIGKMGNILKQAMQVKNHIEELKEQLGEERIEASAGGGMVTVVMSGKLDIISIKLDPEIVDPNDTEMLETLIRAAVLIRHHAHDLVALHLRLKRAANTAVGTRGHYAVVGLSVINDRLFNQRCRRAGLNASATRDAF